eukprot:TRINITY_DN2614_c0_g2_i1.p1 TRINITY_DN2614_c0_g2~~TRINITY_DN2614_c0_g2_i1.p1  ORF type:complete len:298 (+),score=-28.71 TRINITY_DN2614_c0_g2_i1:93-896(+)
MHQLHFFPPHTPVQLLHFGIVLLRNVFNSTACAQQILRGPWQTVRTSYQSFPIQIECNKYSALAFSKPMSTSCETLSSSGTTGSGWRSIENNTDASPLSIKCIKSSMCYEYDMRKKYVSFMLCEHLWHLSISYITDYVVVYLEFVWIYFSHPFIHFYILCLSLNRFIIRFCLFYRLNTRITLRFMIGDDEFRGITDAELLNSMLHFENVRFVREVIETHSIKYQFSLCRKSIFPFQMFQQLPHLLTERKGKFMSMTRDGSKEKFSLH